MQNQPAQKNGSISTESFSGSQANPYVLVLEKTEAFLYAQSGRQSYERQETFRRGASGSLHIGEEVLTLLDREPFDVVLGDTLLDINLRGKYRSPGYFTIDVTAERVEIGISDLLTGRPMLVGALSEVFLTICKLVRACERDFRLFFRTPSVSYRYAIYIESQHIRDIAYGEATNGTLDAFHVSTSAWIPSFSEAQAPATGPRETARATPAEEPKHLFTQRPPKLIDEAAPAQPPAKPEEGEARALKPVARDEARTEARGDEDLAERDAPEETARDAAPKRPRTLRPLIRKEDDEPDPSWEHSAPKPPSVKKTAKRVAEDESADMPGDAAPTKPAEAAKDKDAEKTRKHKKPKERKAPVLPSFNSHRAEAEDDRPVETDAEEDAAAADDEAHTEASFSRHPMRVQRPEEEDRALPAISFKRNRAQDPAPEDTAADDADAGPVVDDTAKPDTQEEASDADAAPAKDAAKPRFQRFRSLRAVRGPVPPTAADPEPEPDAEAAPSAPEPIAETPAEAADTETPHADAVEETGAEDASTEPEVASTPTEPEEDEDAPTTPSAFGLKRPKLRSFGGRTPAPKGSTRLGADPAPTEPDRSAPEPAEPDIAARASEEAEETPPPAAEIRKLREDPITQAPPPPRLASGRGPGQTFSLAKIRRPSKVTLSGAPVRGIAASLDHRPAMDDDDADAPLAYDAANRNDLKPAPQPEPENVPGIETAPEAEAVATPEAVDEAVETAPDTADAAATETQEADVQDATAPAEAATPQDAEATTEETADAPAEEPEGAAAEAQVDAPEALPEPEPAAEAEAADTPDADAAETVADPVPSESVETETADAPAPDAAQAPAVEPQTEPEAPPVAADPEPAPPISTPFARPSDSQPAATPPVSERPTPQAPTTPASIPEQATPDLPPRPAPASPAPLSLAALLSRAPWNTPAPSSDGPPAMSPSGIGPLAMPTPEPEPEPQAPPAPPLPPIEEALMVGTDVTPPELPAPPKRLILIVAQENAPEIEFLGASIAIGLCREYDAPILDLTEQKGSKGIGFWSGVPIYDTLGIETFQTMIAPPEANEEAEGSVPAPDEESETRTAIDEARHVVGYLGYDLFYSDRLDRVEAMLDAFDGECELVLLAREVSSMIAVAQRIKRLAAHSSKVFFVGENASWPRYIDPEQRFDHVPVEIDLPSSSVLLPALLQGQEHGGHADAKPLHAILTAWSQYTLRMMEMGATTKH